jgi:putative multiple sugar transport system substrate-binding protein
MSKGTTLRALAAADLAGVERTAGGGSGATGRLAGIDGPPSGGIARAPDFRRGIFNLGRETVKLMKTLIATVAIGFAAMTFGAHAEDKGLVGIAMPTKSSLRWISDGNELVKALEAKGYKTDLQYAEDDIPNQLAQIENMVTKGPKALIVASIDGTTLSDVLKKAAEQNVKVIAYDRLIKQSPNVDYYTTFDNFQVGVLQANSILKGLGYPEKKGPFNIELFGGSPDDNNAFFFYDGAMSVLKPLIDKGDLVVKSGQMGMEKVGTLRWDAAVAQARMDNILSANYSDGSRVDAVLAPYDGLSRGIISSLRGVGYGTGDQPWPIISGQDAEVPSVKAMIAGEQYSTVYKDTRELAKVTAEVVDQVMQGKEPSQINDTKTYNNGVKVVPSVLLKPVEVDKSNYEELLVKSGYIKAEDLK